MKRQIEEKVKLRHYKFEKVPCGICGKVDFLTLSEKDRYGLDCSNVICKYCGLIQLNPRMSMESYNEFYNEEYRPLYSGKNANAEFFFQGQVKRGKRFYKYLLERGLTHDVSYHTPLVLEVGCGAGGILDFFSDQGYQVQGIDLGEEYLSYGRDQHGLNLSVGTIQELRLDKAPDIVIYSHVLEHILDLSNELESIKKISSENTLVYVEVPGLKSIANGYRSDLLRYFQNAHTYSFTLRTLQNLFENHGFELLYGDEYVKSVFRLKRRQEESQLVSDFNGTMEFIKKSERLRKYYSVSFSRVKMILARLTQH